MIKNEKSKVFFKFVLFCVKQILNIENKCIAKYPVIHKDKNIIVLLFFFSIYNKIVNNGFYTDF